MSGFGTKASSLVNSPSHPSAVLVVRKILHGTQQLFTGKKRLHKQCVGIPIILTGGLASWCSAPVVRAEVDVLGLSTPLTSSKFLMPFQLPPEIPEVQTTLPFESTVPCSRVFRGCRLDCAFSWMTLDGPPLHLVDLLQEPPFLTSSSTALNTDLNAPFRTNGMFLNK